MLIEYGLTPAWQTKFDAAAGENSLLARVIRQDRGFVTVVTDTEFRLTATRAGRNAPVVVGDWVVVEHEAVVRVLERDSMLSRRDARADIEQVIVANVDLVLIVCGADRPLNVRRIERAVAQTIAANARPVVLVTKFDLMKDQTPIDELKIQIPEIDVMVLSSHDDVGLEGVRALIKDKTSVMIGESGAGKSTLMNTLVGEEVVKTGAVRVSDSKGHHTTVRRELYLLPGGGALVDTPGVRAIGLWAEEESVNAAFGDIAELAEQCRFADCHHNREPGCAVNAAMEVGQVQADRVKAYKNLIEEAADTEQRRVTFARKNRGRK